MTIYKGRVTGIPGPSNALSAGTVTTLPTGSPATASISGDPPNQKVNFGIPQGPAGSNATTTSVATQSANGLMSATDKTKIDGINSPSISAVAANGRPVGTAFTVNATRSADVSYSFGYTLTSTLALGQTILIVCTVDGVEVARMADGVLLGLAGNLQKTKSVSFYVPAGKQVLFTKSGTSSVTATVTSGQETLL